MKNLLWIGVILFMAGCGTPKDEDGEASSGKPTTARLTSSNLSSGALNLTQNVQLTNVTGLADSVGFNFTEDLSCGFNVWGANGQTSRSGTEGRTYEEYNLGNPTPWTSQGAGLQGECDSATVSQVESYFVYMDLHLAVAGEDKVVRAYMAQQAPFEAGDIVLYDDGAFSWFDTDSEELVDSTATRPSSPAQFKLNKEVPWFDNNGTEKIIMMEFRIATDSSETYQVTKDTGFAEIDIDFTNSGITVSDPSSDAGILKTITLPFLEASEFNSLLTAKLTLATEKPADFE